MLAVHLPFLHLLYDWEGELVSWRSEIYAGVCFKENQVLR